MAEPFKSTPASRVFGMGLPRRKVDNPGTIFGIEVDEPRWSLDPRLRRDMMQEQGMAMEEQALAAQQAQLARQQRIMEAEDAAISGLEQGEEIGNIFKNNPSLALSRNFGQFANMAEMVRPSKAAQTLAPSIAKSIPAPYRDKYMALVNGDPRYAQDPLGAKTAVETEMGIDEQRGRLRKMGVDTSKLERRLYTPEEEADFEFRVKSDDPLSFYEKRKNLALERLKLWEDRDDTQIPDPKNPTLFVENPEFTKAKTLAVQAMDEHDAELLRRINPQAATATNITSPAAMGGGLPSPVPPSPSGIQVKQPTKPTTEEQIAAVKQLTDNPTALMQVIRSDGSIEAKKEALSKLQEFQKKLPTFQFQSGTPEEIDFIRRNLPNMVNEAKEVIDLEPFKQEVNKAWTTEKNNMASQIKDFAKALNVSPSLVEYWLANNVRYKTEGDPLSDAPARDISIREYFNEYLQNRVGKSLGEEADIMSRFSGSKYASKLGIGNKTLAKALFTQALAPFLGPLAGDVALGGKGPTYEKMLDAYLDEKLNLKPNPVAPQNGNANVGGVPKIQIGTPIKTSS